MFYDYKEKKKVIIKANSQFLACLNSNDFIGARNEILSITSAVKSLKETAHWAYLHGDFKLANRVYKDSENFSNHITTCWLKLTDRMLCLIDDIARIDW